MKKLFFALAVALTCAVQSAPKYEGPIKAEEVRARDGIGHVLEKIRAGKEITVAYLGGSITEMSGWRNLTTEWLRKTYRHDDRILDQAFRGQRQDEEFLQARRTAF